MVTDDMQLIDRIVVSRDVCHGKPRISGTRIMIHHVLDLLAAGKSIAEITSEDYYPDISEADILACITYASHVVQHEVIVPTT